MGYRDFAAVQQKRLLRKRSGLSLKLVPFIWCGRMEISAKKAFTIICAAN